MEKVTLSTMENIQVKCLSKDPNHPRQNLGDLESLTQSIRHQGIINPLFVRKVNENSYLVFEGGRRLEVAILLGMETVPCIVYEGITAGDAAHKSYLLNTERNQLSPIECAQHIQKMRDGFAYTYDELEILGYGSRSQISKLLNLLKLPNETQKDIASGKLTVAHGEKLLKLENPEKIKHAAKLAIDNEWSAKKTGSTIERINRKAKQEQKPELKVGSSFKVIPGVYFKDSKVMIELPNGSVHCICTSPPYFVGEEYELGYTFAEHLENVMAVMSECARVLVPGGTMAINVTDITNFKGKNGKNKFKQIKPMLPIYQAILKKHGVYLQDQIIWFKDSNPFTQDDSKIYSEKTAHADYRIIYRHEPIYIFRKEGEREIPSEDIVLESRITKEEWKIYAPSVWKIDRIHKTDGHPTMFPDEVAHRIIKMYSFVGETVLDPFLGSGTTVKVARKLGREGIGYERDLRYKDTIMKKLGVAEPTEKKETISEYVARNLKDLEDNQPAKPEVETLMSEGMRESVEKILQGKELEMA